MSATPNGTFSQKIQCHEMPETTAPPISGPNATAIPAMPLQAPMNAPRRLAGTAALRIVSVSGMMIAPPKPCTARAAINALADGARAAAAEARVKMPSPTASIRRRPNRSPSAAPVRRKTAKVRVYALTVHSRLSMFAPRSLRITGSAVVTTRLSSVAMKTATDVIAKAHIVRALAVMSSSFSSSFRWCAAAAAGWLRLPGVLWCG